MSAATPFGLSSLPLLSIITWSPFVGALLIMFLARRNALLVRGLAVASTAVSLVFSIVVYVAYDRDAAGFQFYEDVPLVPPLGINYQLGIDGMSLLLILRTCPAHQIGEQLGILFVEQLFEGLLLGERCHRIAGFEITLQDDVELAHPAATTPPQAGDGRRERIAGGIRLGRAPWLALAAAQCLRSAISFLISAIAFAGFRSFGQASVQFMIVWQRYSLNGSSSASSRSPVASSRVSMIQRYAASNAAGPRYRSLFHQ